MLNNQGFEELAYKKMFMDAKTTLGILKIKYLVLITKKRQENKEWTAIGMKKYILYDRLAIKYTPTKFN